MAATRRRYDNMDDILDKLLDSDCSDLNDIELGDKSGNDSDWEYESEDERVLCGDGVGDADCGAGSSVVRDGKIEDSVCRASGDECGGLVGGGDDDDQSDNDDVDSGGHGGPDCLCDGVRGRGGIRVCGGHFCDAGGSGRHAVRVCGGVHGSGCGLGVLDHEVADLQWEPADIADEELLDDTFPFNVTEGLKVQMNQQQNVLDFFAALFDRRND